MVLVFAEYQSGQFKKNVLEAVTYGHKAAQLLGTECAAITLGSVENADQLGKYGASKVYNVADTALDKLDSQVYAAVIANAAKELGAKVVIVNHSSSGKALLGRLAVRLNAGSVPSVTSLPETGGSFKVKKPVFSGNAIATVEVKSDVIALSLMGNAIQPEVAGDAVAVEALSVEVPQGKIKVTAVERQEGKVPLPEADKVVSGGRGLKDGANWGVLEELADVMGATLACSRPVSDADWRPHHEHVGQTGLAIAPNLYVAVGISGAIQHLAGVNNSKTIVVINKDPEAPFFKAADYGVCADLFEVVPKLTEAMRNFKS